MAFPCRFPGVRDHPSAAAVVPDGRADALSVTSGVGQPGEVVALDDHGAQVADTRTARAVVADVARRKVEPATRTPGRADQVDAPEPLPISVKRQFSTENAVTGAIGPATSSRLPPVPANEDPSKRTRSAWSTTARTFAVPDGAANVQVSKVMPLMLGPTMRRTPLTGRVMLVRVKRHVADRAPGGRSVWMRISCVSALALRAMSTEQSVNLSRWMVPLLCVFLTTMPRFVPEPRQLLNEQSLTEAVMPPSPRVHSSRATMNRLTVLAPVQPT